MPPTPTGPLQGVRVLDLSSVVMGPLATQILGDLGADVITVEDPRGTLSRVMTAGPVPTLSGLALNLLRNKRNVILDLKDPEGRREALDIASTVDAVVTNLRPGTLARLGMAYEDVAGRPRGRRLLPGPGLPLGLARRRRPGVRRRHPGRLGHSRHVPSHGRRARPGAHPGGRQGERADHRLRRPGRPLRAGADRPGPADRGPHDRRHDGLHPRRTRRAGHHRATPRAARATAGSSTPSASRSAPPTAGSTCWPTPARTTRTCSPRPVGRTSPTTSASTPPGPASPTPTASTATWRACSPPGPRPSGWSSAAASASRRRPVPTLEELVDALPEDDHPLAGRYKVIPQPVRFANHPGPTVRRHAAVSGEHTDEVRAEVAARRAGHRPDEEER